MKTMKKLSILLALALAAIFVFTACGPKGGGTTPTEAPTETVTEATTEAPTEAPTEEPTTQASTGYPRPVLTSDSWSNEALNLKMTVPSTWTMYTEEQLADEYNGGAAEPAVGETFYEAFAQLTGGGDNVSIIVQNATGQTETIKSLGIKAFTELISDGIPEALESSGATNVQYGLVDIDFPLDDYACINCTCELYGTAVHQKQIVALEGDYLYSITVTAFNDAGVADVLGFFSKLK